MSTSDGSLPVSLSYRLERDDHQAAIRILKVNLHHPRRRRWIGKGLIALLTAAVAVLCFDLFELMKSATDHRSQMSAAVALGAAGVAWAALGLIDHLNKRWAIDDALLDSENVDTFQIRFDDGAVLVHGTHTDTLRRWSRFDGFIATQQHALLRFSKTMLIVPRRVFAGDTEFQSFCADVKSRIEASQATP